jgi:PmbA protein
VEVFAVQTEETPVRFEANHLKQLLSRQSSGIALRIIKDGRIGFAATTSPDDVEALVAMAMDVAPFGAEARFGFPGPSAYPNVPVYDDAVAAVPTDHMVQLGQSMIDRVRADASDLLCEGSVRRAITRVRLLTSAGVDVARREPSRTAR